MYIKKKDQELFKQLDKNLEMPIYWNKFIKEISQKNRLIIKESKGLYFCTNCHKKFSENFKVNDYCKCPKCGNVYLVKTQKLRRYTFKQDLAILQKFENYYIVRSFAMNTFYKDSKFYNENFEYGRMIYDDKLNLVNEIVNDNVVGTISGWWISFRSNDSYKWRYYNSNRFYLTDEFMYYPYNLEELLKNFENLKYSMLWELVKHVSCNLIYLIKNYNPSIEMLTKMELYNLALCPKSFLRKNNFNERFMGLTKDYIPFIREHNLNYDELIILSKIKIKNYDFIKKLEYIQLYDLEKLPKIINIITLLNKTDFDSSKFFEYQDYLKMAKDLKLDLKDKNILYPKEIKQAHDILLDQYEKYKDKITDKSIKRRAKKLQKYIYEDNEFIIFPAENYESLIDESSQQKNCVRTYAERIANGECDIYFMRYKKTKEKSLVTIEVQKHKVVQKRTKNNEKTTKKQDRFLKKWEEKILIN